ncbi:hypothetical protein MLK50_25385 [Escherichia coli]|nr:hypothetical protein [Escherichia coli]MCN2557439.1 hypothetical protein [Escherichia coli]
MFDGAGIYASGWRLAV